MFTPQTCLHFHLIENIRTFTSQDTLHARCIAEELHLKQGREKARRRHKKDKKDTSHSNFVAKNHKSQGTQSWQKMCTLHITFKILPTKLLHFALRKM
jgi:hypothetical protein